MRGQMPTFDGTRDLADWTEVVPVGGWNNLGGFNTLAYRRINGIVYWKGVISDGAAGVAICFLPPGTIPDNGSIYPWRGLVETNTGVAVVFIRVSDGAVYTPLAGGSGVYLNFDSLRPYPAAY